MARGHEQRSADMNMAQSEINWGFNCLTVGIHHGRPEVIWNLPLLYAATVLFRKDELKEIVLSRIFNDAMQFVDAGVMLSQEGRGEKVPCSKEWADAVRAQAEKRYDHTLQHKIGELSNYYQTHGWRRDVHGVVSQIHNDRLNRGYEPLHPHDSINMLCRIVGTRASIGASK